jgi:hypothetical protein
MEKSNLNLKKQELLKKEIIDNNLDKDAFLEYCINQKENGDDLDLWEYEELEETIKVFNKNYKKNSLKEIEEKENYQIKKNNIKKEINEDNNISSKSQIQFLKRDCEDNTENYAVNVFYKIIYFLFKYYNIIL